MKKYVKPEIEVLSLRLEERIAGCTDVETEVDPGGVRVGGNGPNGGQRTNPDCWTQPVYEYTVAVS